MSENADDQAVDFFIRRADLAAQTADHHLHDNEFQKAADLYKQAYAFYLKAQQNLPQDQLIRQKLDLTKQKYQETKAKIAANQVKPAP